MTSVYLTTRTIGQCFATIGQIRSLRTKRVLRETDLYGYGFVGAALQTAEQLATRKHYHIASIDDGSRLIAAGR